jgi:hypothetical protein
MSEEKREERGACEELRDAMSHLARAFGISDTAQEHFRQSQVEMLKGIRTILDEQIAHASRAWHAKGTRVVVE